MRVIIKENRKDTLYEVKKVYREDNNGSVFAYMDLSDGKTIEFEFPDKRDFENVFLQLYREGMANLNLYNYRVVE